MVTSDNCPDTQVRRVVIRPNRSLSWRQSMVFLGAISVPLLLIFRCAQCVVIGSSCRLPGELCGVVCASTWCRMPPSAAR